jgi:hypothetical protein
MKVGLCGQNVTAALWAGPGVELKAALAAAEATFKLPAPRIGGVRAKDAPEMMQGYILEKTGNASAAIAEAAASGLKYVMMLGFYETDGSYIINRKMFPKGDADLKAFVGKLHDAGLKVGMHFLSAHITKTDPYVVPIPSPDLALDDARLVGAAGVEETSTFIPLAKPPLNNPWVETVWKADAASGILGGTTYYFDTRLIVIGQELITYTGINSSGLVNATRGALGTKVASHSSGSEVGHLAQMYGMLLPRPDSVLFDKIASRVAAIYTGSNFDMVYFDGAEGMAALGSEQVPISLFQHLFFEKIGGADILVEGSSTVPYTWWLNARANTGDYAFIDPKSYMDVQKSAQIEVHRRNAMNAEMGWCVYRGYR